MYVAAHTSRIMIALCAGALALSACSEKDETAPPAPRVDPIASPTSSSTQEITGSAEYGATVVIAGGVKAVSVEADPFTALFRATVELLPVEGTDISRTTTLSFEATDAAGNTSEPTLVDVEVGPEPGLTTDIAFAFSPDGGTTLSIEAGDPINYTYTTTDAYGNATDEPILVVVNSPDAIVFDDGLSGTGLILGLTRAGDYGITVRSANGGAESTATVSVAVASGDRYIDLGLTLARMAVGDTVVALVTVRDIWGNLIDTPDPTIAVERQDAGTIGVGEVEQTGNDFAIHRSGVYRFAATFDDGSNPAASATVYLLVEQVPDLQPPVIRVLSVDGYSVCNDGTLKADVPTDCTDSIPAILFTPGRLVSIEFEVDDDRSLSEISFKAFGFGLSADDFMLVGNGDHTPGAPFLARFVFRVGNGIVPGDAALVAQAIDGAGNIANSAVTLLRLDLGIDVFGDRTMETVAGSTIFSTPYDVTWNEATDSAYITNRNNNDRVVMAIDGDGTILPIATFGSDPEYVAVDAGGNVFTVLRNDDLMITDATGATSRYDNFSDPEGLSIVDSGRASTGRVRFGSPPIDQACVEVGASVFEFDSVATGPNSGCQGAGGVCGTAQTSCVTFDGTLNDAMDQLAAAVNADAGLPVIAGIADDCDDQGEPCVYFIATTLGSGQNITVQTSVGNMTSMNVHGGQDASLLYVADVGNGGGGNIFELQIPSNANRLATWTNPNRCREPNDVHTWLEDGRLIMLTVDEQNDELCLYDTAARTWIRIDQGRPLDQPWSVVRTANNCAIVANRGSDDIIAYDLNNPGSNPTTIADGFDRLRGISLEGTGPNAALLIVDEGNDFVGRITATPALDDCF